MTTFLLKLWSFVRPYRVRFILGLLCGVVYGLSNGVLVLGIKLVVDLVFHQQKEFHTKLGTWVDSVPRVLHPLAEGIAARIPDFHEPKTHAGWILVFSLIPSVMLVRGVLDYLNVYLTNWASCRAIADIRTKLFDHLLNLPLGFFSRASTGDLIARITNDTQILSGIIGSSFVSMIKDPVTIIVLLTIQLTTQTRLTLVSFIVMPLCIVPIIIFGQKVRKSARAMQGHISDLTGLMHESFTGNRIIKAYNLEDAVRDRFRATTSKYVGHVMRVLRANEIPSRLTEFLGALGVALVFTYVEWLPKEKQPSPGAFTSFLGSILLMYPPLKSITRLHNQLNQARAASQRVFDLLDTKTTVVDPPNPQPLVAKGADITFENVDFVYDEKPVLRGVNLRVQAGQLIALVGRTGSGKTTVTNLLMRFYDPQNGAIRIGGTNLRDVSLKGLRSQIALVTQDTILFNDTIRRNIALGRPGATDAEIEAAAKQANAHEFIVQKEGGYEFNVGEKGGKLSGGQKQRLAIARAILKDAPILILDEATSALDSEVERAVQAELEKLMEGRTTFCIAHRLSTIHRADLIVVLHEGRIVETGTHAELLRHDGVYRKLHDLQFQADDAGKKNGFPTLLVNDLVNLPSLANKLQQPKDSVSAYVKSRLSDPTLTALANYQGASSDPAPLQTALIADFNSIIGGESIYETQRFAGVILRPETQQLLLQNPRGEALARRNRLLLEDAYPLDISRNQKN